MGFISECFCPFLPHSSNWCRTQRILWQLSELPWESLLLFYCCVQVWKDKFIALIIQWCLRDCLQPKETLNSVLNCPSKCLSSTSTCWDFEWWRVWSVLSAWGCNFEGAWACGSSLLLPSDAGTHACFWQTISKSLCDENFYLAGKWVQGLGQVENQTVCMDTSAWVGLVAKKTGISKMGKRGGPWFNCNVELYDVQNRGETQPQVLQIHPDIINSCRKASSVLAFILMLIWLCSRSGDVTVRKRHCFASALSPQQPCCVCVHCFWFKRNRPAVRGQNRTVPIGAVSCGIALNWAGYLDGATVTWCVLQQVQGMKEIWEFFFLKTSLMDD